MRAAAARRVAEAEALATFERYSPNGSGPVYMLAALEALVARVTAFADFATARIETLTAQEWAAFGRRTAAEVDLFRQACRDAGRLLTDVARLGLDQPGHWRPAGRMPRWRCGRSGGWPSRPAPRSGTSCAAWATLTRPVIRVWPQSALRSSAGSRAAMSDPPAMAAP